MNLVIILTHEYYNQYSYNKRGNGKMVWLPTIGIQSYSLVVFDMFSLQKHFLKLKVVATFPNMYGENTIITNPIYYPTSSFFQNTII